MVRSGVDRKHFRCVKVSNRGNGKVFFKQQSELLLGK